MAGLERRGAAPTIPRTKTETVMSADAAEALTEKRVSTVELFFDLVFVFSVTQMTHFVEHVGTLKGALAAVGVLSFVWWMYSGYVWLVSHIEDGPRLRLVLIAAMLACFVMALGIAPLQEGHPLRFGIGGTFVVAVHASAFVLLAGPSAAHSILRYVVINLAMVALILAATLLGGAAAVALYVALIAFTLWAVTLNKGDGFTLHAGHFVERHGLLLLIVLGETVAVIGDALGAGQGLGGLLPAVLALLLIAMIWLLYFAEDDRQAEQAMRSADRRQAARIALVGFWGAFCLMIAGILCVAVGLIGALATHRAEAPIAILPAGLALVLTGALVFRRSIGAGPVALLPRATGLLAVLALWHYAPGGDMAIAGGFACLALVNLAEAGLRRFRPRPVA